MSIQKIYHIIILTGILLTGVINAQQKVDGIAAIVGNEIILLSDINAAVAQYSLQNKLNLSDKPQLYNELSHKFLQNAINEKLLIIKADEDTIKADDDRVEQTLGQQLDYMVQQVGSVDKLEEYYGSSMAKIKKDFRKQIQDRFRIDLLRQKRFGDVKISRREVEEFYKQYSDSLGTIPPTVDISHILLQVNPSDESLQEAYAKAMEIKKKLDEGADFAKLAEEYSEDPGSASRGGDLGFVSRGDLVKEFEEVAFALDEGEISDIVQSQFGFHIIQLLERQGEKVHVRHILIRLQPTKKDEQAVFEKLTEIRQKIINGDSTFEEMALKYSNDPNVDDDKGHLGKYRTDSFQIEAFATVCKSLEPGEISPPFKTEFGYHIVKLHSRQEARDVSLKQDWEQIEQLALEYKRKQKFEEWIASLREDIPIEVKMNL